MICMFYHVQSVPDINALEQGHEYHGWANILQLLVLLECHSQVEQRPAKRTKSIVGWFLSACEVVTFFVAFVKIRTPSIQGEAHRTPSSQTSRCGEIGIAHVTTPTTNPPI